MFSWITCSCLSPVKPSRKPVFII